MKLLVTFLSFIVLSVSSVSPAMNFSTPTCVNKSWHDDFRGLIQRVNVFQDENRGPISVRGPEEGLKPRDIQRAEENIVTIYCPAHEPGRVIETGGSFIGSNDQLVTNMHAFVDNAGIPYDPLSKCVFKHTALVGARGANFHPLNLKDGVEGLKQLQAIGLIKMGIYPKDKKDDYAVVKLKERVDWVKPYQLAKSSVELHGCKDSEPCQQIISISAINDRMPFKVKSTDLILQTSNLHAVIYPHSDHESTLFTNTSATEGSSGTLQFLRDDSGKLLRDSDGELLPIAILARTSDKSNDGKPYSAKDKIVSESIGLDAKVLSDIQAMAGKSQTAEISDDPSLPSNNDGN